jgi:hypothetical protein
MDGGARAAAIAKRFQAKPLSFRVKQTRQDKTHVVAAAGRGAADSHRDQVDADGVDLKAAAEKNQQQKNVATTAPGSTRALKFARALPISTMSIANPIKRRSDRIEFSRFFMVTFESP